MDRKSADALRSMPVFREYEAYLKEELLERKEGLVEVTVDNLKLEQGYIKGLEFAINFIDDHFTGGKDHVD